MMRYGLLGNTIAYGPKVPALDHIASHILGTEVTDNK
jgi:hypothetical protein